MITNVNSVSKRSSYNHIFGTSGIRRLVDSEFVQLALRVGQAVGTIYQHVTIGRDTRTSGSAMYNAVTAGLLSAGAHCHDAGIVPTPTLAIITREFEAGIMVTASHNPPQFNGLKLLNADGSAFSSLQQEQIEDLVNGLVPVKSRWDKMRNVESYNIAKEEHISRITNFFPGRGKLKVVVDAGCGAGYDITPELLRHSGYDVVTLNCHASGFFPHDIEPIEANLTDLMAVVKETGADLGIAHDGDADRMMAVDDRGRFISGDKLLAILAQASGSKTIVTTIDASMAIEDMGFKVKRTKVGDPYISEELKKGSGAGFGGEPSGAWVFPQISLCPDGIFAAAQIADIASRQKLSVLVDSIPSYPVIRGNLSGYLTNIAEFHQKLISLLNPLFVDNLDGLKFVVKDGWVLVRPSGTEPKLRITVEARDQETASWLYEKSTKLIAEYIQVSN